MIKKVFVVSSSNALGFAGSIEGKINKYFEVEAREQHYAEPRVEATIWKEYFQQPHQYADDYLQIVTKAADESALAIVLLRADDRLIRKKGEVSKEYKTTRDNVLFEAGLFVQALGKKKVLLLYDSDEAYWRPTDISGLNIEKCGYENNYPTRDTVYTVIEWLKNALEQNGDTNVYTVGGQQNMNDMSSTESTSNVQLNKMEKQPFANPHEIVPNVIIDEKGGEQNMKPYLAD